MAVSQEEVIKLLQAPDAIMEPGVLRTIQSFMSNGGNPEDIVTHLSDGYCGFADMCGLLGEWLQDTGMQSDETATLVQDHIKTIIKQNFNAERANSILESGKAPWLNEMIQFPTWRKMIYDLSLVHINTPFLNLVIKRICDAGYLDEIAHVTSVANEVDVFSAVMSHTIIKLIGQSEAELEKSLEDFCCLACQSQHTYLFTQSVLHGAMSHHRHHAVIKRLSQELQSFAMTKQRDVWLYSLLFSGSTLFPSVISALQSILNSRELSPPDISKLHEAFSRASPPPVDLLRVPALFDLLISNLFTPTPLPKDHRDRCIFVLAYAASTRDEIAASGYVHHITVELQDTIAALESAITTLQESTLHASAISVLYETLKFPVVGQGLLHWLRPELCSPAFFTGFNSQIVPPQVALVDQIATNHELLHAPCFSLLRSMLSTNYTLDPVPALDVQRMILDRVIYLLSLGYVVPVVDFISEQAHMHTFDLSLTVHFVEQTLSVCGPPFSAAWVEAVVHVLGLDEVLMSLRKRPAAVVESVTGVFHDMLSTEGVPAPVLALVEAAAAKFRK